MKAVFKTNIIMFLIALPICLNAQIVADKSFSTFHPRTEMSCEKSVFKTGRNITSQNYTNADIICEDRDGDGYYFWGIGTKPAHCPACAPNEPDGDDSNPNLGQMDEYGNCAVIPHSVDITSSQTWNTNRTISNNITVPSGVTLTITATAYLSIYTITIKCGGKLIVSGGIIDDGNVVAQSGSEVTISNNGKVLLGNYDNLDVQLGAEFNLNYGEVLLQ